MCHYLLLPYRALKDSAQTAKKKKDRRASSRTGVCHVDPRRLGQPPSCASHTPKHPMPPSRGHGAARAFHALAAASCHPSHHTHTRIHTPPPPAPHTPPPTGREGLWDWGRDAGGKHLLQQATTRTPTLPHCRQTHQPRFSLPGLATQDLPPACTTPPPPFTRAWKGQL